MSEILPQSFVLNNREDVIKFENLTKLYQTGRVQYALQHLSLLKVYDHCQRRGDDKKLFYVLLDIYINFTMLYCDMMSANKGKSIGVNVLDSKECFFEKMDMHRFYSAYIFRYRALWDKLMGLMVLLCVSEEQYEKYIKANSRSKKFKSICNEFQAIPIDIAEKFLEIIKEFDDEFRTAEAHGSGSLRKWSFLMGSSNDTPVDNLLAYWNHINTVMCSVGEMFNALENSK